MAKARMYGMNKQFVPNSKADSRFGRKNARHRKTGLVWNEYKAASGEIQPEKKGCVTDGRK